MSDTPFVVFPAPDANPAATNGKAWLATIVAGMAALNALQDGEAESVTVEGETYDDADTLRDDLQERPLSVLVRGGWRRVDASNGAKAEPEEFAILLTTGGPGLRIAGELGAWNAPQGARLQWQDWGVPWTDLDVSDKEQEALDAFCELFYFGE